MIWICAEDVLAIHTRVIRRSGGVDGLRDRPGLEAALSAPLQSFGGVELFPTGLEKIARLGYGLAANHAFLDGNKRIGAMMTHPAAAAVERLPSGAGARGAGGVLYRHRRRGAGRGGAAGLDTGPSGPLTV